MIEESDERRKGGQGGLPDEQNSRVGIELVALAVDFKVDLTADGIVEVELTVDHVLPGGGV